MSDLEVVTSFFQPSTRAETEKFCSSRHNSFIRVPAVDLHPLKFSFLEKKFGPNCPLCRILVKGVIAHVPENHSKSVLISMGEKENKALDSPRILPSFSINLEEVRDGHKDIELFSTDSPLVPYRPNIQLQPGVDTYLTALVSEARTCYAEHKLCSSNLINAPNRNFSTLPARIIDVTVECQPFLVEPRENDFGPYATLSYCWGENPSFIKTTSERLEQHKVSIDWNSLPQLFRDAITLTRAFELRYLWIDALCIIQDLSKDWELESSKMGSTFAKSYIVFGSLEGENPNNGILERKAPVCIERGDGAHGENIEGTIFAYLRMVPRLNPETGGASKPRLFRRGWAYQEMMLPTRIVLFAEHSVIFRCRSKTYDVVTGSAPDDPILPEERWFGKVTQYAPLTLTNESDRLPAISGLASTFNRDGKDRYLAGLWKSELPGNLGWYSGTNIYALRPSTYVAPSWSWASITHGSVHELVPADEPFECVMGEVITVDCDVKKENPYGEVAGSSLVLCAPVVWQTIQSPRAIMTLFWEGAIISYNSDHHQREMYKQPEQTLAFAGWEFHGKKRTIVFTLALKKTGREDSSYERIGIVRLLKKKNSQGFYEHCEEWHERMAQVFKDITPTNMKLI